MIHKAGEEAKKEHEDERDEEISSEEFCEYMEEPLAALLENVLAVFVKYFAPDFLLGAEASAEEMLSFSDEEVYSGTNAHGLFAPLLSSTINRIDLEQAARLIMDHIMQPVTSAPLWN